ncbi:MAG TPA: hypothetical protein VK625_15940 [Flavitalea sp.]|nr:hypothetical protein [Flavitalea sp.]
MLILFSGCFDDKHREAQAQSYMSFVQKTRLVDSNFVSSVKLDELIVCNSTITDLKKLGYELVAMPKTEIDSLITAENWQEGSYFADNNKKLIVGTYDDTELLTSIFLTPGFSGKLRGFKIDDFSKLTVKQITSYFKDLDWSTTGVSNYWIFGNDTVNFYIKVDNSIPRFPLNEKYYEDKHPVLAKIQYSCDKVYGDVYGKSDTVMRKPLYAPLVDTHLNYYLLRRKPGIGTTIREITSTGKKTIMEQIRVGKWVNYNPDHTIQSIEYYNNGVLVKEDK